jgi:hypothetical protein
MRFRNNRRFCSGRRWRQWWPRCWSRGPEPRRREQSCQCRTAGTKIGGASHAHAVDVIATIRRILLVTLETSDQSMESNARLGSMSSFSNAMIELSVLGMLTLVLAVAIYLARRSSA